MLFCRYIRLFPVQFFFGLFLFGCEHLLLHPSRFFCRFPGRGSVVYLFYFGAQFFNASFPIEMLTALLLTGYGDSRGNVNEPHRTFCLVYMLPALTAGSVCLHFTFFKKLLICLRQTYQIHWGLFFIQFFKHLFNAAQ